MIPVILESITTCIILVGGISALGRWIGKLDRNSEATEALTAAFNKFTEKTSDTLIDHEIRLVKLEDKA